MEISKEKLQHLIDSCDTLKAVLESIGLSPTLRNNYSMLHRKLDEYGIDLTGIRRRSRQYLGSLSKGRRKSNYGPRVPVEEYLSNRRSTNSHDLKVRLLKEGIFTRRCKMCSQDSWMGQPIPLELDHINGDSQDNSLENIRLLCPNCHALTPNYKIRNSKAYKAKRAT